MAKVCGVGINNMPSGWVHSSKFNRTIYTRWRHMLDRCYNPNNPSYKNYGAKGYYVDFSLHYLSDYIDVLRKDPLWNDFCKNPNLYDIDKDFSQQGKAIKVYSASTIQIVLRSDNRREGITRLDHKAKVNHTDYKARGKKIAEKQSIPIKATNLTTGEVRYYPSAKSARKDGFNDSNIRGVCKGKLKQYKGWFFEELPK